MEDQDADDLYEPPIDTNTFAVPQDHGLLLAYEVYKPSVDTKKLKSEQGRHIYAEAFIEDMKLGSLSDLSVRTLAKELGQYGALPIVSEDPLKLRIHYDSLKIDIPLEQCYHLTDAGFWRRVVLEKCDDKALAFKKDYDWRGHGLSLKYVEMIEASVAEYWEEEKMTALALKIRDFVTQMHISRLQSLSLRSFEHFFDSEPEGDSLGSEDSSEISTVSETSEASEIDEQVTQPTEIIGDVLEEKTASQLELEQKQIEEKIAQRNMLHDEREKRRKLRAIKIERRERRAAKRLEAMEAELAAAAKKKKKKKKNIKNIYDIELSSDEDNNADDEKLQIADHRNKGPCLHRLKKYKFPPEDCHHVNLSFIRHFQCLTTFIIEFLGPLQQRDYHVRHMNFSYTDIENLANGLTYLQHLQVFRLRNSRMDERKLSTLANVLRTLEHLEVVDFGNDQLRDDCGNALHDLLSGNCTTMHSLELEGNYFGPDTMEMLGKAIAGYTGELNYLGLSHNLLGEEALHALVTNILDTEQVRELNLAGVSLTQEGIICCIANELLNAHSVLVRLYVTGMPIGPTAGTEVLNALQTNTTILEFECRGCDLDYDMELDVAIILRRNRFIAQNPFVGDDEKTEEEINEWISRVKNPIMLDAMAKVEQRATCNAQRPDEFHLDESKLTLATPKQSADEMSLDKLITEEASTHESEETESTESCISCKLPFIYDTSTFDEEQFLQHLYVPGPRERYHYFQELKHPAYYKYLDE